MCECDWVAGAEGGGTRFGLTQRKAKLMNNTQLIILILVLLLLFGGGGFFWSRRG
jgi:hypothetical protein